MGFQTKTHWFIGGRIEGMDRDGDVYTLKDLDHDRAGVLVVDVDIPGRGRHGELTSLGEGFSPLDQRGPGRHSSHPAAARALREGGHCAAALSVRGGPRGARDEVLSEAVTGQLTGPDHAPLVDEAHHVALDQVHAFLRGIHPENLVARHQGVRKLRLHYVISDVRGSAI